MKNNQYYILLWIGLFGILSRCAPDKKEFSYFSFVIHGRNNDSCDVNAFEILEDGRAYIYKGYGKDSGSYINTLSKTEMTSIVDSISHLISIRDTFFDGSLLLERNFKAIFKYSNDSITWHGDYSNLPSEYYNFFEGLYLKVFRGSVRTTDSYLFKAQPVINAHRKEKWLQPKLDDR